MPIIRRLVLKIIFYFIRKKKMSTNREDYFKTYYNEHKEQYKVYARRAYEKLSKTLLGRLWLRIRWWIKI